MTNKKKFDWIAFIIHSFFGAMLGAIAGYSLLFFLEFFINLNDGLVVGVCAVFYGLIAGFKKDNFWMSLSK